jgi:hypothetical protein
MTVEEAVGTGFYQEALVPQGQGMAADTFTGLEYEKLGRFPRPFREALETVGHGQSRDPAPHDDVTHPC